MTQDSDDPSKLVRQASKEAQDSTQILESADEKAGNIFTIAGDFIGIAERIGRLTPRTLAILFGSTISCILSILLADRGIIPSEDKTLLLGFLAIAGGALGGLLFRESQTESLARQIESTNNNAVRKALEERHRYEPKIIILQRLQQEFPSEKIAPEKFLNYVFREQTDPEADRRDRPSLPPDKDAGSSE